MHHVYELHCVENNVTFQSFSYKSNIYMCACVCVNRIWHLITHKVLYGMKHNQTKPHTHTHIYIYIYIYLYHHHHLEHGYPWSSLATPPYCPRFRQVLSVASCIYTELLYVCSSWSLCLCSSMCRGPQEFITNELVPTPPAVSRMSSSSNFDSFHDGW